MNTDMFAPVVAYCAQEVWRQNHDPSKLEGLWRVQGMLEAWCEALEAKAKGQPLTVGMVEMWGRLVEPDHNAEGFRKVNVIVGGEQRPRHEHVRVMLGDLFEQVDTLAPWDFYRAFEIIHPFRDGNGRTGKIIAAYLSDTLENPVFPPADFWGGRPIRNP